MGIRYRTWEDKMSKHILDHPGTRTDLSRAAHYARIARKTGPKPHPKVKAAMRAGDHGASGGRLRAYLRVERGQSV